MVEALAELYFEGSAWDLTIPGSFYERVKDRFPNKSQMDLLALEVQVDQGGARTQTAPGDTRMVFRSRDETRLVQIGRDVLVVNQLRPYPSFETWSPVLLEMLAEYRELARPTGIARLGLRYINRIVIPEEPVWMEDYFRLYPALPPELGLEHGPFLMRVELRPPHRHHQLLVTFGSAQAERRGQMAYMLDIYNTLPNLNSNDLTSVATWLVEAHDNVEHAFESAIADKTRQLFDVEQP